MRARLRSWSKLTAAVLFLVHSSGVGLAQSLDEVVASRAQQAQRAMEDALRAGPVRGRFLERFPGNYIFSPEDSALPVATVLNPTVVGTLAVGPLVNATGTYVESSRGLQISHYTLAATERAAPALPVVAADAAAVTRAFAAADGIVRRLTEAARPGAMSVEERAVDPRSPVGRDVLQGIRDYIRAYRQALDSGSTAAVDAIVRRWADVRATITDTLPDGSQYKAIYQLSELYEPWRYQRIYQDADAVVAIADLNGRAFCSGAIIGEDLVLTAGHCFSGPPRREPKDVEVWFDYVDLADGTRKPLTRREIAAEPVAPPVERWADLLEGRFDKQLYDYAILRIKPPGGGFAALPSGVVPLCLRRSPLDRKEALYVMGFPQGKPATVHDNGRVELPYRVVKGHDFDLLRMQVDADFLGTSDRAKVLREFDQSYVLDPTPTPAGQQYYYFHDIRDGGQPRMGISVDTFKGNSGGPVFDHLRRQCLVGILNRGMPDTPASLPANWRYSRARAACSRHSGRSREIFGDGTAPHRQQTEDRAMTRFLCAAILQALVLLCASHATAQEFRPKLLALVVGIERYDDTELDKLTFAADDAKSVYDQLRVIADLEPGSLLLLADDDEGTRVTAGQLREKIETFVQKIDNNSTVIVYLGGHGTLSAAKDLWFLPSDFLPRLQTNRLPFKDILRYFEEQIRSQQLHNVKVAFLLNMCGAGNATAAADPNIRWMNVNPDPEDVRAIQKTIKELQLGVANIAVLPATPRGRNTFENAELKRSIFAYHLLDGLRGAAAQDGVITTGGLFDYLNSKFGGDLARPDPFDSNLRIGMTQHLEGEASFHIASALLAGARSLRSISSRRLSAEAGEFGAQAAVLEDLALSEFGRVSLRKAELAGRTALRRGALKAMAGRALPEELLAQLRAATHLTAEEHLEVKQMLAGSAGSLFSTPDVFLEHLRTNEPYVLLITGRSGAPGADVNNEDMAWSSLLRELSPTNFAHVFLDLSRGRLNGEQLLDRIKGWRQDNERRSPEQRRFLLMVYSGAAGLEPKPGRRTECDPGDQVKDDCILIPIGNDLIQQLSDAWAGPLAVIFDAPFGGYVLKNPPRAVNPTVLLLSAEQPNGMTFWKSGEQWNCATSQLMVRALREKVRDLQRFAPLVECNKEYAGLEGGQFKFEIGRPAWIPTWSGMQSWADWHLRPTTRYVLQTAAGCVTQAFAGCDKAISDEGLGPQDPFARLIDATDYDLAGLHANAAETYYNIVRQLTKASEAPRDGLFGMQAAWRTLQKLRGAIEERASGVRAKIQRKVVVLPIAVENYRSPLVARVPHAITDVKAYTRIIENYLTRQNTEVRININDVVTPATKEEFFRALNDAAATLDKEAGDLLVLAFSGRGYESDGRRYLALADVVPTEVSGSTLGSPFVARALGPQWSREFLVDIWDIAEHMKGHWFFAIYDVQFTRPITDGNRLDLILDKNLESARPLPAPAPRVFETAPVRAERPRLSIARRGMLPAQQIHLWIDGRITQNVEPTNRCSKGSRFPGASPLATAIGAVLHPTFVGTFRDFAERLQADDCLSTTRGETKSLVLQGDVDVPVLGSGRGAEYVDFFQDGLALADANLQVADRVALEVSSRFPSTRNRLARAALLVGLAQLHGHAPVRDFSDERDSWLQTARDILQGLMPVPSPAATFTSPLQRETQNAQSTAGASSRVEGGEIDHALVPIKLELLSRIFILQGEPQQAWTVLKQADPQTALMERNLAGRLVDITRQLIRLQPNEVLKSVSERLGQLTATANSVAAAKKELDELLRTRRANEPYRITPAASTR